MKLTYKPINASTLDFIHVKRINQPYLGYNWHFHEEFELIYFLEGQGIRIVGDHISHFNKGELVLVGAWLPHLWRNDVVETHEQESDFIVVKFRRQFGQAHLFTLPELSNIKTLLKQSHRGLFFSPVTKDRIHDRMVQLAESQGAEKLILLLQVLQVLSEENEFMPLSSPEFIRPLQAAEENRLQTVINYIFDNHHKNIPLEEIAEVAFMTPPAFCRFFKKRTNKTFSHFLNEFRVGKSCQLLINSEKSIKQICYEAGFNSLTNFNRTFKTFKNITPSAYRKNFSFFL
ncbi:MAG: AraC family transcriptional regulator [Saprospiraceae bacterium]|nr:AraC family transcriptional regulator [Saprospiraceae bacterium]